MFDAPVYKVVNSYALILPLNRPTTALLRQIVFKKHNKTYY